MKKASLEISNARLEVVAPLSYRRVEEACELPRRFVLGNRIKLFERGRECVRETPHCPRAEVFVLWIEVQIVDARAKARQGGNMNEIAIYQSRALANVAAQLITK